MNREHILLVADAIEHHKLPSIGFNMSCLMMEHGHYPDLSGRGCGTVACIAGHAVILSSPDTNWSKAFLNDIEDAAQKYLDIREDQAFDLFFADNGPDLTDITLEMAVRTLRHFAETGVIKWVFADE